MEMYSPIADNDDNRDWDEWTNVAGYKEDGDMNASFRIVPFKRYLLPFLTAFAKGAEQMKRLKRYFPLWTTLIWDPYDVEQIDSLEITNHIYTRGAMGVV